MFKKKFFKNFLDDEPDSNAPRNKFVQHRIKMVEKYIPELEKALSDYTDKTAKARDCVDRVAEVLDSYSKAENITAGFKFQISDFANVLLDVGKRQDMQVNAMEKKVLVHFSEREKLCKDIQTALKLSSTANEKEKNLMKQLHRIKGNQLQDPEQISIAEAEYLKSKGEAARASRNLEEQIDFFEKKKLSALKEALMAWSLTELHFHSKALELFTETYRIAADIEVDADIEEFRNRLRSTADSPRSDSLQRSESVLQLLSSHRNSKFSDGGVSRQNSGPSSSRSSLL